MKGIKDKSPAQEPVTTNGKGERGCLLDGGNGIFHVKKRGFLGDGKFRRKPASHNIVLTLLNTTWRRNTRFLVDVLVRGRPAFPNMILAIEEKEMIPHGWNWQREASNKHQDPGHV